MHLLDLGLCSSQHSARRGSGDILAGHPARLREPRRIPRRFRLGRRLLSVRTPPLPSRLGYHRLHAALDRLLEVS
ncbi:MAG: hypothetical protein ACK56F_25245, partial [bacterium]